MFSKKFSSNIKKKRRMIILSIILLVVFLSTGYAVFTTSLEVSGTLKVDKYDHSLYGVLEKAVTTGHAREYTGNHQDSMAGVGSEKIYHWYAPSTTAGNTLATEILDKNNVIFADHCWQMIRTTDTGGVKMIYNGESENGQCLNTRANHIGYNSVGEYSLSTTYYYGTSYNYDKENNVFSLDGTVTTGTIQTGQYTCRNTSSTGTCSTLALVVDPIDSSTYSCIEIKNDSHYSQFGKSKFNVSYNSPAYVGYMYNTTYPTVIRSSDTFTITNTSSWTINTNYYYSSTIDYNVTTPNEYTLLNPARISTLSNYNDLLGKYVLYLTNNAHGTTARYITAVDGNKVYYKELKNGDLNTSLTVGDSYTKSGNTYTLTNPTNVTYIDWYSNTSDYSIYKGKYVCDGNNTSCTNLKYTDPSNNPTANNYYYFSTDDAWSFAESITYSNGIYTLTGDIKTFWNFFDTTYQTDLPAHHYTCLNNGSTCTTVGYVILVSGTKIYYSQLSGVANVNQALTNMLSTDGVNQVNSTMKLAIESWYKKYLYNYTSYLEDTVFCNDRSIKSVGNWNSTNGGVTSSISLEFKNYDDLNGNNSLDDLNCTDITDRFSISNNKAPLNYPVGLETYTESYLLGNNRIRKSAQNYWLNTPFYFFQNYASGVYVTSSGNYGYMGVHNGFGIRPVVSLKPGTEYVSGTGSMADPYVVE